MLAGPRSLAVNRAAIAGVPAEPELADAFTLLFGLAVRDTQIRALLTTATLTRPQIQARARHAIDLFYRLYAPQP
jgi:hypothetical protein